MVVLGYLTLPCFGNPQLVEIGKTAKPIRETGSEKINGDFKRLCENNRIREAFECLNSQKNPNPGINPSSSGLLLQACTKERFLGGGLQVHAQMIKRGFEFTQFLCTKLMNLYIRCGSLDLARQLFDTRGVRKSLISWNSIITGYCRFRLIQEALFLFSELRVNGFEPDQFTFSVIFEVIEQHKELFLGQQFHSLSIKLGYGEEEFVGNSLIQMYAACGRIDDSVQVFQQISETRSPVAWNSMIARLVENELHGNGLELYEWMLRAGIEPTPLTFSSVLKACGASEAISEGKQVHAQVIIRGFYLNVILETALVDHYVKCGELENGRLVFEKMDFRSVVTWNSMIRGYSEMGYLEEALKLFKLMKKEDIMPDKFTFPALLIGATAKEFKALHTHIVKIGLKADRFIATSLISMYSTNQNFDDARLAFEDADSMDIGLWSSMISACVKNREGDEALWLFSKMVEMDVEPNQFIYSSLFMACANLSTLEMGKQMHAYSLKSKYPFDLAMENSLLTMYSNCGCIREAQRIFNSIENPNVISFNSMISALAQHGLPREAAELFRQMKLAGLRPDEITFVALLSAFNHTGLVNDGLHLFYSMKESHGHEPSYKHYACVADMLARAGEIEAAIRFINDMPFEPEPSLWRVVLGACSKHRNVEIGRRVGELLLELEPNEVITYVVLGNIYARSGRWAEAESIRHLMEDRGIEKDVAFSWIEINRRSHVFGAEDRSHPQSKEIYEKLEELIREIKVVGYVPDISFAVYGMENERREESLYYHSEKLAFAFGILSSARGFPIRIMKNLRVCGDCHSAYKYFSLITGREIILRDNFRFHHFTKGNCSCGDYW